MKNELQKEHSKFHGTLIWHITKFTASFLHSKYDAIYFQLLLLFFKFISSKIWSKKIDNIQFNNFYSRPIC